MKKYTTEWWKKQSEEDEFHWSMRKISYILQWTGKWNRSAKVLEIQCGLGSMPQYMADNGYSFMGTDNDSALADLWDNFEVIKMVEPDNTGFDDNQFHLVCWFSMFDERIEQERIPEVLKEMERIGNGAIIVQPFNSYSKGKDTEFMTYMMDNGWMCSDVNPAHKFFMFHREK